MLVGLAGTGVTVLVIAMLLASSSASTGATRRGSTSGSFGWLVPHLAPSTWHRVATPSGNAVLAYPMSFSPIAGDAGSVSAGVKSSTGQLLAYVNVTPQQGAEKLQGFGQFRLNLIGEDDDKDVHLQAKAQNLAFRQGAGSCVMDDYRTRIGDNHYREVACLVDGKHGGSVLVAAAADADWIRFLPQLRQVVTSFSVS